MKHSYTHQYISITNFLTDHFDAYLLSVHQSVVTMATTYLQVSNESYHMTSQHTHTQAAKHTYTHMYTHANLQSQHTIYIVEEVSHHVCPIVREVDFGVELQAVDGQRVVLDGSNETTGVGNGMARLSQLLDGVTMGQQHLLIH